MLPLNWARTYKIAGNLILAEKGLNLRLIPRPRFSTRRSDPFASRLRIRSGPAPGSSIQHPADQLWPVPEKRTIRAFSISRHVKALKNLSLEAHAQSCVIILNVGLVQPTFWDFVPNSFVLCTPSAQKI